MEGGQQAGHGQEVDSASSDEVPAKEKLCRQTPSRATCKTPPHTHTPLCGQVHAVQVTAHLGIRWCLVSGISRSHSWHSPSPSACWAAAAASTSLANSCSSFRMKAATSAASTCTQHRPKKTAAAQVTDPGCASQM